MNKRKKRAKLHLNIRFCFMVGLIMYLFCAIICQEFSLHKNSEEISLLEEQIAAAQESLNAVKDKDELSRSDAYVERVAREELGLVMPDEKVFVDITGR